jgi:hypothetical protein
VTPVPGRVLAGAFASAQAWLVEPADAARAAPPAMAAGAAPVVAVYGLSPGCRSSLVARALGAELATRDACGAATVSCESVPGAVALSTSHAARLLRRLAVVPADGTRAVGRLCLVAGADPLVLSDLGRALGPVVLDAGEGALGGREAAVAGEVVLVAPSHAEPSLAEVGGACLARVGPAPLLVISGGGAGWKGRADVVLPRSRLAARLALGGREPPGDFGRAIARLADMVEGGLRTTHTG